MPVSISFRKYPVRNRTARSHRSTVPAGLQSRPVLTKMPVDFGRVELVLFISIAGTYAAEEKTGHHRYRLIDRRRSRVRNARRLLSRAALRSRRQTG
ncbi:hypothetical protein NSND_61453 [Nitrospira sp. ND1]|nr:hypothetical protein NSND_61453 [Nitrospira sp. ND1]